MKAPKEVWIIWDPMDGPHIYKSLKAAQRDYDRWGKAAKRNSCDSFWDMIGPIAYSALAQGKER